jgi:hypothetical protein
LIAGPESHLRVAFFMVEAFIMQGASAVFLP